MPRHRLEFTDQLVKHGQQKSLATIKDDVRSLERDLGQNAKNSAAVVIDLPVPHRKPLLVIAHIPSWA